MNKKALVKNFSILLILLVFTFYILANHQEFKKINFSNPLLFIALLALLLLFLLNNGLVLKELILPFKINLLFKEWFGLSVITSAGNLLVPLQGGTAIRALYLKSKYNFPYTHFLGTLSGIYIIVFWINSLAAIVAMFLIKHYYSVFNWLVFGTFLAIFLVLTFIAVISPKINKTFKSEILNKITRVVNGWLIIKENKRTILIIAAISLGNVFLMSTASFLEFLMIGAEVSFLKAFFISIVSTLSLFISLTPGSLGIKEAFVVFTSAVVGISPTSAISVSILDRLVSLIPLLILAPIFSKILFGKVNFRKIKNNVQV